MKNEKPIIVHMVEAFNKVGGPPKLVRQIISSELISKYDFIVLSYEITGISLITTIDLRHKLKEIKPDIVHIHGLKNDGFHAILAAKMAKVPRIILAIHGTTADSISEYNTYSGKMKKWIIEFILEPLTLRLANYVYCVCEAMRNRRRIQKHTRKNIKNTIYNGVVISEKIFNKKEIRNYFNCKLDDIIIIYTGRISTDKGIFVLVDAFEELIKKEKTSAVKIKLLIVGDGPEFENLSNRCEELTSKGYVLLAGKRDDVDKLLFISNIFVLPTFHENLSFSLLEAMGMGMPVIVTAVGGNIEIVENGLNGIVVPSNNVEALTKALHELVCDVGQRNKIGFNAKQRVKTYFSLKQVIENTDKLYHEILEE